MNVQAELRVSAVKKQLHFYASSLICLMKQSLKDEVLPSVYITYVSHSASDQEFGISVNFRVTARKKIWISCVGLQDLSSEG